VQARVPIGATTSLLYGNHESAKGFLFSFQHLHEYRRKY